MPSRHCTPPSICLATSTPSILAAGSCCLARSNSVSKPSRTAASPVTFSSTPPISVLWRISGETILRTAGPFNAWAAATACAGAVQTVSGTTAMPAFERIDFAVASLGVLSGKLMAARVGDGRVGWRSNAWPYLPMAAMAATARLGSSNTVKPSCS